MKDNILKWYLKRSTAPPEQLALYVHLDQPFLFPDPKRVLKELIGESTTKAEEEKESFKGKNRSVDSDAVNETVRGIG